MYKLIWKILNKKEKQKSFFFLVLTFFNTVFEIAIVLTVIPLTQILLNKTVELPYFGEIEFLNNYTYSESVFFSIVMLLFMFLIKNFFLMFYMYWQVNFIGKIELRLSTKLLEKYIYRPYFYHLNSNTGFLSNNVLGEVIHIPGNIKCILTLISEVSVLIIISTILVLHEPQGTLVIIGISLFLLVILNMFQRKYMSQIGSDRFRYTNLSNKHLLESLNNIKDIKLLNKENYFINNFFYNFGLATKFKIFYEFLSTVPRTIYELIMVVAFCGLVIFLLERNDPDIIILTTSLYLIATYRLLPSIVRITGSFQTIELIRKVVMTLIIDLLKYDEEIDKVKSLEKNSKKFELNKEINLENISFSYTQNTKLILNNVNIKINKGEMIGIVGSSGSGKTTLIDIFLGLLKPIVGKISVDGVEINEKNKKSFQDIIGYVPQSPAFIDETIKKNIAFGIEDEDIDNKLIEASVNGANLKEFLASQKDGLNTIIGEKAIRISGGQKQRIAIARALYKNPDIVIFDEATASLDEKNETEIIKNISLVKRTKTVIVIAHKLSILKNCDKILKIENGKIYE